jgi:putative ABC transport system permease protein
MRNGEDVTSRLLTADLIRVGSIGLRTRRLRAALSAIGIAIGIASMVAVLGISQSSKADLLAQLDELGTNLLTITPGQSLLGEEATLPVTAPKMIARLSPVEQVASVGTTEATLRRTNYIPAAQTNGISVLAADTNLLATLNGTVEQGVFLNAANTRYPAIVLGSVTAERLAITSLEAGPMVYVDGRWLTVVGILDPLPLAPDIDRSALVGDPIAEELFGAASDPTTIHVRTDPDTLADTRGLLPATANPQNPEEVQVSRPPMSSRPARPRRPPTPRSSSASAPSHSSSAVSASPTSWSSPSSSGAPRSDCDGHSAPANATSPSSS